MSEASRTTTRGRMLESAVALLSVAGPQGVTIDQVLRDSGAPRGSVYHHFPGGRAEMVTGAVEAASEMLVERLTALSENATPEECLGQLVEFWKAQLTVSDYTRGCPILAATIDDGSIPELADVVAGTFEQWHRLIAGALGSAGVPAARAQTLTTAVIAATEGAIALSRAARSTDPLDDVNRELQLLIDQAIPSD